MKKVKYSAGKNNNKRNPFLALRANAVSFFRPDLKLSFSLFPLPASLNWRAQNLKHNCLPLYSRAETALTLVQNSKDYQLSAYKYVFTGGEAPTRSSEWNGEQKISSAQHLSVTGLATSQSFLSHSLHSFAI